MFIHALDLDTNTVVIINTRQIINARIIPEGMHLILRDNEAIKIKATYRELTARLKSLPTGSDVEQS